MVNDYTMKKVKVASVWTATEEKELEKNGKKYIICDVSIKVADDSGEYAGKRLYGGTFKTPKHTAIENALYFKNQNEGKTILVKIQEYKYEKDGEKKVSLKFRIPSKEDKLKYYENN